MTFKYIFPLVFSRLFKNNFNSLYLTVFYFLYIRAIFDEDRSSFQRLVTIFDFRLLLDSLGLSFCIEMYFSSLRRNTTSAP